MCIELIRKTVALVGGSQAALAEAIRGSRVAKEAGVGCSQVAVHKWVTGKNRPSPTMARAIEEVTGGRVAAHEIRPDAFGLPKEAA